jgi:hypothetical protein
MNRSLLTLLVAFAVLIVAYLIINSAKDVTYKPRPFVAVDTTKLDAIAIRSKSDTLLLKRIAGGWHLAEPVVYPADYRFVHDLLVKLENVEIENLISDEPGKDSIFQVDESGSRVTALAGTDTLADFIVGKMSSDSRHTYTRKMGQREVYLVKGTFSGQLSRKAKDWRDKEILNFPPESVVSLEFQAPKETFRIEKQDSLWYVHQGGKTSPADTKIVDRTLSALSKFRTFDFLDGDSTRMVDFTKPDLVLNIQTDGGSQYTLMLTPQDKEANRYYVKKSGVDNTLFIIYKGSANMLLKKADEFIKKENA